MIIATKLPGKTGKPDIEPGPLPELCATTGRMPKSEAQRFKLEDRPYRENPAKPQALSR